MNIDLEIIAFIASTMGIGGSIPQILKILRTGETRALSYGNYLMITAGSSMWVLYGCLAPVYSIIMWNTISVFLALSVISLKMKNEKPEIWLAAANLFHVKVPARILSVLIVISTTAAAIGAI